MTYAIHLGRLYLHDIRFLSNHPYTFTKLIRRNLFAVLFLHAEVMDDSHTSTFWYLSTLGYYANFLRLTRDRNVRGKTSSGNREFGKGSGGGLCASLSSSAKWAALTTSFRLFRRCRHSRVHAYLLKRLLIIHKPCGVRPLPQASGFNTTACYEEP